MNKEEIMERANKMQSLLEDGDKGKQEFDNIFKKEAEPFLLQNKVQGKFKKGAQDLYEAGGELSEEIEQSVRQNLELGNKDEAKIEITRTFQDFFGDDIDPKVEIDFKTYHYGELGSGSVFIEGLKVLDIQANIDDGDSEIDFNEMAWEVAFLKVISKLNLDNGEMKEKAGKMEKLLKEINEKEEELESLNKKEIEPFLNQKAATDKHGELKNLKVIEHELSQELVSDLSRALGRGDVEGAEEDAETNFKEFLGHDFETDVKIDMETWHYGEFGKADVYVEGIKVMHIESNIDDGNVFEDEDAFDDKAWRVAFLKLTSRLNLKEAGEEE